MHAYLKTYCGRMKQLFSETSPAKWHRNFTGRCRLT